MRAVVAASNTQDWEQLEELVPEGFVRHSHASGEPGMRSRSDLLQFLRGELAAFPDAHEHLEALVAEEGLGRSPTTVPWDPAQLTGPHPPIGTVMTTERTSPAIAWKPPNREDLGGVG